MKNEAIPMDCATFESVVHDLDRPGTSGSVQCESALAHAESCHACAALLSQVEWLDFGLLETAEKATGRQASPRVEAALLEEFRRTKDVAARKQIGWRLAALATAAALFLALGLTLRHIGWSSSASVPTVGAQSSLETSQTKSATSTDPAQLGSASADADDGEESGETADAGSFLPLPYADDSAAVDGGAIVRVELPRAALASFGLPVAEVGGGERVLADLIVSVDGTPEAIRLVSDSNSSQEF